MQMCHSPRAWIMMNIVMYMLMGTFSRWCALHYYFSLHWLCRWRRWWWNYWMFNRMFHHNWRRMHRWMGYFWPRENCWLLWWW
uniref:Putative secreted protein n=1 Tax=Panstrongylus lignarius TaxID=156445 RepID=A0A224Y345_9HEMI